MAMGSEAGAGNTYEEARKQRLEENRKRFKDLGISDLSKSLSKISGSPTGNSKQRPPRQRPKPGAVSEEFQPRRSSRSRNAVVSYVDDFQADLDLYHKRGRRGGSSSRLNPSWTDYIARPLDEVVLASYEERERARKAAERFEKTLPACHPSFVKSMVRSHVYSCFWLGLPSHFCMKNLPKRDSDLVLEDESGSTHDTKYIANRAGLSGGWRGYALDHKLNDGDALVFQLVEPDRFKIYTFRTSSVAGEEPNPVTTDRKQPTDSKNPPATATQLDPPSRKRQKVKEGKKDEEDNDNAGDGDGDGEESQPKARRGSGRRTAFKNQMKENGLALKPQNDKQDLVPEEQQQAEGRGRKSGRRSKVADEAEEIVLGLEARNGKQCEAVKEKEEKEGVVGEKAGKKVGKARKKAAPRLFRRKVFRD